MCAHHYKAGGPMVARHRRTHAGETGVHIGLVDRCPLQPAAPCGVNDAFPCPGERCRTSDYPARLLDRRAGPNPSLNAAIAGNGPCCSEAPGKGLGSKASCSCYVSAAMPGTSETAACCPQSLLLVLAVGVVQFAVDSGVGIRVLGALRVAVDVRIQERDVVQDVEVAEGAIDDPRVRRCGGDNGRADSQNGSSENASLGQHAINGRR